MLFTRRVAVLCSAAVVAVSMLPGGWCLDTQPSATTRTATATLPSVSDDVDTQTFTELHRRSADKPAPYSDSNVKNETLVRELDELIEQNPVVIFSKTWCPYSAKAKRVFASYKHMHPKAKIIEADLERKLARYHAWNAVEPAITAYLAERTGQTTYPNVFLNGTSIGGGDKMEELRKSGTLRRMLIDANLLKQRRVRVPQPPPAAVVQAQQASAPAKPSNDFEYQRHQDAQLTDDAANMTPTDALV